MKPKLNLALWIVAGILAVVFLVASSTKLFVPKEKLAGMGGAASRWVEDFTPVPSRPSEPSSSWRRSAWSARCGRHRAGSGAAGCYRCGVAVRWRGDHAPAPW